MLVDQLFDIYEPIFCSRCAKIVKRCILIHFVSFCVFPRVITSWKVWRSTILAFLPCYKLMLFLWLRIWGSLLRNLTSWPCWDHGCRLNHLYCWFFGCCYRLSCGCQFRDLVLVDHWWCQNNIWIFHHSGHWYSLACSLPWLLLLYHQLDVHAPHLTNKTSSAIDVVALLDGLFIMVLLILW